MGSSGEMATAEHVKRERVVCLNAAVSGTNGKALYKSSDWLVPPVLGGLGGVYVCLHACISFPGCLKS